jgi:hypothetical protein
MLSAALLVEKREIAVVGRERQPCSFGWWPVAGGWFVLREKKKYC